MAWTFDQIDNAWLHGGRLALPADEIAQAFNRAEKILGADWIESKFVKSGSVIRGALPTLEVVTVGLQLQAIEGMLRSDDLVAAILRDERYALSELEALYILKGGMDDVEAEMYPPDPTGGNRVVDFRIRKDDESWTYVEVTRPDYSDIARRSRTMMEEIANIIDHVNQRFALEVVLRRDPTYEELDEIRERVSSICNLEPPRREELPDELGFLSLGIGQEGLVEFRGYHSDGIKPGLFLAHSFRGPNEYSRQIIVTLAFSDERAEAILDQEASQLPKFGSGLVMVDMSGTQGGLSIWEPLITHRFQPTIHTRVSAMYLWAPVVDTNESMLMRSKKECLIINPHAAISLPAWIGIKLGLSVSGSVSGN